MNKFFKTLLVILFFAGTTYAQKIRFTDTTNHWRSVFWGLSSGSPNVMTSDASVGYLADTIISNTGYHVLSNGYVRIAVRAGSMPEKIYFRFIVGFSADTNEHLLYDFGMKVNDSLNMDFDSYHATYIVRSVDSVMIQGVYHKILAFDNDHIVEGIGSLSNPFWPIRPETFRSGCQLQCFTNSSGTPALSRSLYITYQPGPYSGPALVPYFDNDGSCVRLSVHPATSSAKTVVVHPNPGSKDIILKASAPIEHGTLMIYNASGQVVINNALTHATTINIGVLLSVPGLYYYRLSDMGESKDYGGRFVVQ